MNLYDVEYHYADEEGSLMLAVRADSKADVIKHMAETRPGSIIDYIDLV